MIHITPIKSQNKTLGYRLFTFRGHHSNQNQDIRFYIVSPVFEDKEASYVIRPKVVTHSMVVTCV